jgi:SsrA-binding protein
MPVLATNKRAKLDYEILDTYEAGLVLHGQEVKSIKTGHISLKGAFIHLKSALGNKYELVLVNAHIPKYQRAGELTGYDPDRSRKVLVKKTQIKYLIGKKNEQGLTLVPLKIYTKKSLIKLEFGIGKGRKKYEKRDVIKKREVEKRLKTLTKRKT